MIHQDDLSSLKIDRGSAPDRPRNRGMLGRVLSALLFMGIGAGAMWLILGMQAEPQKEPQKQTSSANPGASGLPSTYTAPGSFALTASGYIVSKQKSVLSSKVSGRITAIHVREGDMVKAARLLVEIDDRELQSQLQLERVNLEKAQSNFNRGEKMFQSGLISESEQVDLSTNLKLAQSRVQLLETQVSETRIHAPFDGAVLKKNQEVGEMTSGSGGNSSSSEGILTIADLAHMEAEVDVEEKYIGQVSVGQPVEVIAIEAYPDRKFEGTVDRIIPTADRAKRTVRVMISITHPQNILRPDMNAKVTFLEKPKEGNKK